MAWRKIRITGSRTAEIWKEVQDGFEAIFIASGAPEDAAMYFSSETPGRDVTLYLSPGAVRIFPADGWGATSCDKPSAAGLLVGHDSARLDIAAT